MILHILNVIMVYFLVHVIMQSGKKSFYGHDDTKWTGYYFIPFLTALFFAVHPIHTESINFIKNRSDLMALLFLGMSILFFVKDSVSKNNIYYVLSLVLSIAAILSKSVVVVLPVILILYIVLFKPVKEYGFYAAKTIPFALIMAVFLFFRISYRQLNAPVAYGFNITVWGRLLIVFKTLGYYFYILVFPVNLNAMRHLDFRMSITDPGVILSVVVLPVIFYVVIKNIKRSRLSCFGFFWIIFMILPVSNILINRARPIAEQRLYLPSLGFCLLLAVFIHKLWSLNIIYFKKTRIAAVFLSIAIIIFYSGVTINRNPDWKDEVSFWTKTIQRSPGNPKSYNNLGYAYFHKGNYDMAIKYASKASAIKPEYSSPHNLLGMVYERRGDLDRALEEFTAALMIEPDNYTYTNNKGLIHFKLGDHAKALSEFKNAKKLDPDKLLAYKNTAIVYTHQDKFAKAIQEYQMIMKIDNKNVMAYAGLGYVYWMADDKEKAMEQYIAIENIKKNRENN
ncbi:tetratricopeptide repeat protein [Elusimicrobiota bacterium]